MTTRILIIGGGAGGLELACALGKKLGKRGRADITLVDRNPTHLWKPLLHEVATGAMDSSVDEISYRAVALQNHFRFVLGDFRGLDRAAQRIMLKPVHDSEGREILPERHLAYDYLVLALGSITDDFRIPGVREHGTFLDSQEQAQDFHRRFLNLLMQVDNQRREAPDTTVRIPIVGGGATGVELAAELVHAADCVRDYGFPRISRDVMKITVVEAGPRLLPALPERISVATNRELKALGIDVRLNTRISRAYPDHLVSDRNQKLPGDLMVWAAGVQGPELMEHLDGLSLHPNRLLKVSATLQSVDDPAIFALGDCAACPQGERFVPPRAQSAHQMASHLARNLPRAMAGKSLQPFVYRDHGSLINLSQYSTVGTLMGGLSGGSLRVEGRVARLVYVSLYRMHQIAIYGWARGLLIAITDRLHRAIRPRLKLH